MSQFDVLRIALDMMTEEEVSCKRQDRGNVDHTLAGEGRILLSHMF